MKNKTYRITSFLCTLSVMFSLTACGGNKQKQSDNNFGITLPFTQNVRASAPVASFPAPLYKNWFVQLSKKVPQLQFNFQSIGSDGGREQFTSETVDFVDFIVLAYNLPGVENLKLTREAYTNIFLGHITNWNDPKIAKANPEIDLPDYPIAVVHRSDESETTLVFTTHLSEISSEWKENIGSGTAVQWPTTRAKYLG